MSSRFVRVLLPLTVTALLAGGVSSATPAVAGPSSLPAPTVSPTHVAAGTTTVVAGTGCLGPNGGATEVSAWLSDGAGHVIDTGRTASGESNPDGTWSIRLTVPLATKPSDQLGVHAACGWSDLPNYRLYPDRRVVVLASSATPWHAQDPQLPKVPNGELEDSSCATASSCVAVGSFRRAAVQTPLAEVFDGTTWQISPLPALRNSRGATLHAVSCAKATACTAVGQVTTADGIEPLVASYHAGAWTQTVLPVTSDNPNITEAVLAGVSCPAASQCVAVGRAGVLSGSAPFEVPSAYVLRAGTWSTTTFDDYDQRLTSVSCLSATACLAVGTPEVGAGNVVELFDGSTWTAGPQPTDPQVKLTSVSCPGQGCVAVGFATDGRIDTALQPWAGVLDPTGWTEVPLGDVGTGRLEAVWCQDATTCVALGQRGTLYAPGASFAVRRSRTTWSVAPVADGAVLTGVSCPPTGGCTTVGTQRGVPLVLRAKAASWTAAVVPAPSGLPDGGFDAVACAADSACTAVGRYVDAVGVERPLVERWDGGAWTLQTTPDVESGRLTGVACPSTSVCTAVGRVEVTGQPQRPLIMQWGTASGWQVVDTAATEGALTAVSCGSVDTCLAVGGDRGSPLTVALQAGRWAATAPAPVGDLTDVVMPTVSCVGTVCRTAANGYQGAGTASATIGLVRKGVAWTADPQQNTTVSAISCLTPTRCDATLTGGFSPTVVRINGAKRTGQELPNAGDALSGLSCRAETSCVAVGANSLGASITRWTGRTWQLEPIATSVPYVSRLAGIACPTGGSRCVAVGGDDGPPTILVDTGDH